MAYSRWSKYSVWYTFWDAGYSESTSFKLPTKRLRDNQYFEICDFDEPIRISYKELKEIGIKYQTPAPKTTPIPWFNKHVNTSNKQTALQENESTNYVIGVMSDNLDYDQLPSL